MLTTDPFHALVAAQQRGRELQAEAAEARLAGTSTMRGALAAYLRRAADRLDPAPLAVTTASR